MVQTQTPLTYALEMAASWLARRCLYHISRARATISMVQKRCLMSTYGSNNMPVTSAEFASMLTPLQHHLTHGNQRVGVAVSGGPDSMALISLVQEWATQHSGMSVTVLSLDHAVRSGSAAECAGVREYAVANSIPCIAGRVAWGPDGPPSKSKLQQECRRMRRDWLLQQCAARDIKYV